MRCSLLAPVAALLLVLAAPAAAAGQTVTSGGLTAEVTASPFSVKFVQAQGPVLQTAGGVGHRRPGGAWTRMTDAQVACDGDALVAAGDGMRVRIAPPAKAS